MLEMEKDPADRELIEILGGVKDAIGEWHDWQELLTIAREQLTSRVQVQTDSLAAADDSAKTEACAGGSECGQEAHAAVTGRNPPHRLKTRQCIFGESPLAPSFPLNLPHT